MIPKMEMVVPTVQQCYMKLNEHALFVASVTHDGHPKKVFSRFFQKIKNFFLSHRKTNLKDQERKGTAVWNLLWMLPFDDF